MYTYNNKEVIANQTLWKNFTLFPEGNGTVLGYVKESGTLDPISGATVHLNGSTHYLINTDSLGYFIFNDNVSAGFYTSETFKMGMDGFQEAGESFNLSTNETFG